jgi:Protein of unknown function (DUF2911)
MHRFRFPAAALAVAVLCSTALVAQKTTQLKPGGGGSPHVRSEFVIDGANISIEYGRPSIKGRTVGKEVATYGEEWRTGADEATTIKTDKGLMFGALHVNPGTYTLYTLPGEKQWQLIISKKTGQWGIPYPKGEDVGRAPMTVSTAPAATEQLTISIEDTKTGGTLHLDWGTTRVSAPFTVM